MKFCLGSYFRNVSCTFYHSGAGKHSSLSVITVFNRAWRLFVFTTRSTGRRRQRSLPSLPNRDQLDHSGHGGGGLLIKLSRIKPRPPASVGHKLCRYTVNFVYMKMIKGETSLVWKADSDVSGIFGLCDTESYGRDHNQRWTRQYVRGPDMTV